MRRGIFPFGYYRRVKMKKEAFMVLSILFVPIIIAIFTIKKVSFKK